MKYFTTIKRESFLTLSFIFLISILFSSCVSKTYVPEIPNELESEAVYTFGDFTYKCKVLKADDYVSVEVLDTKAKGLKIKCDGKTVCFTQWSFEKVFPVEKIDVTNPAVVLFNVFSTLESAQVTMNDGSYYFTSKIPAGTYTLIMSKANKIISVSVPESKIYIEFY